LWLNLHSLSIPNSTCFPRHPPLPAPYRHHLPPHHPHHDRRRRPTNPQMGTISTNPGPDWLGTQDGGKQEARSSPGGERGAYSWACQI
jgi:hypothetical protein